MAGLEPVRTDVLVEKRIAVALFDIVEFIAHFRIIVVILRKVFDCSDRQRREIARGHPVIGVGQAADIGEMAVFQSDLLALLIHQRGKGLLAAGQTLGENEAGVVAGLNDHPLQQILDRDAAADRHEHLGSLAPPGALAHRQLVGQRRAPLLEHAEDDVGGHDLAHRRRRDALVRTLVEQYRAGLHFEDQRVLRLRFDPDARLRRRRFGSGGRFGLGLDARGLCRLTRKTGRKHRSGGENPS